MCSPRTGWAGGTEAWVSRVVVQTTEQSPLSRDLAIPRAVDHTSEASSGQQRARCALPGVQLPILTRVVPKTATCMSIRGHPQVLSVRMSSRIASQSELADQMRFRS